jgi:hypothetical protein
MGFLSEDRTLFRNRTGVADIEADTEEREDSDGSQETVGTTTETTSIGDPEKGRMVTQKLIML